MPCPNCGGAFRVIDDNGVTDPKNGDRWELWECQNCGTRQTKTLKA